MEKVLAFVVFLFGISNAIIRNGKCPETKNIPNFEITDLDKMKWYPYGRYPNEIQPDNKRVAYEGVVYKNGYKLKAIGIAEGSPDYRETILIPGSSKNVDTEIQVTYGTPQKTLTIDAKVLLYDPNNYILLYACCHDIEENLTYEYAWLYTTTEKIDDLTKEGLKLYIKHSTYVLSREDRHPSGWSRGRKLVYNKVPNNDPNKCFKLKCV